MLYLYTLIAIIVVLLVVLPGLIITALVTVGERKSMAYMQRRLGPNFVGWFGLLQPFADALKLLLKEYILPLLSNKLLFLLGPMITLMFSLLAYAMITYGPGLAIADFDLGVLYILGVFSMATYGILTSGWSANSKFAFLGCLRSTAQLISYELILTSSILLAVLIWGSFNLSSIVENQKSTWTGVPLSPMFYIFSKTCLAETNRAPFDLAEAESELVSGYMTEHAAAVFVSFFLGEYSSILLISMFSTILFLGSYLISFIPLLYLFWLAARFLYETDFTSVYVTSGFLYYKNVYFNTTIDGFLSCLALGFKTVVMVFGFILVRASFPRIRFDQLITYCWTILLAVVVGFIIVIPCILSGLGMMPSNDILFSGLMVLGKPMYRSFSSSSRLAVKRDREGSNDLEEVNTKKIKQDNVAQASSDVAMQDYPEQASKSTLGENQDDTSQVGGNDNLDSTSQVDENENSPNISVASPQGGDQASEDSEQSSLVGSSPSLGPYSPTNNQPAPSSPTQHFPRADSEESKASSSYDGSSDASRLSERAKWLRESAEQYDEIKAELEEARVLQQRVNAGEILSKDDEHHLGWVKHHHFDSEQITAWDKTQDRTFEGQIGENSQRKSTILLKAEAKEAKAENIRGSLLDDFADPSTEPGDFMGGDD